MTYQCIVCSSSGIQSEDSEIKTITSIGFTDEEFWIVFSNLFHLDSFIISSNCNDPLDLKFCSTCKPTAIKLFNLHHQLKCIQRQLSQTIAHVTSTVLRTDKSCNDNIRKAIYQRFTPRIVLEKYQLKPNQFKRNSSQQKNEESSTSNVIKIESSSCTLKKDDNDDEDDFHSTEDLNCPVEEDDCVLDGDKSDIDDGDDDHLMNDKNDSDSDFDPKEFSPPKKGHLNKASKTIKRVNKSVQNAIPKVSRSKGMSKRKQTKILVAQRRKLLENGDLVSFQSESEPVQESQSTDVDIDHSRFKEIGPGKYLYLDKHEYTKEPDGYYKCGSCVNGRRKKRNDVHRHINNKHNKADRISCDKCNGHWDSQNRMDKHVCRPKLYIRQRRIKKHDDDRYSYDNQYFFVQRNDLFLCLTCNETQKSISNMSAHIVRRHAAPSRFVCEQCGAAFGSKKNFLTHIVQHSDLRPYLCDQCPAAFKTPEHLWCHQKSHSAPQYECNVCTKKFKYSHGLRRHRLSAGHPAPPRPQSESLFYCPKCNNSYLLQHTLDIHLKTCTGKKEFPCNECDKNFPKLSILRGHQYWNHKKLKKKAEKQHELENPTSSKNETQKSETFVKSLNVDLNQEEDHFFT